MQRMAGTDGTSRLCVACRMASCFTSSAGGAACGTRSASLTSHRLPQSTPMLVRLFAECGCVGCWPRCCWSAQWIDIDSDRLAPLHTRAAPYRNPEAAPPSSASSAHSAPTAAPAAPPQPAPSRKRLREEACIRRPTDDFDLLLDQLAAVLPIRPAEWETVRRNYRQLTTEDASSCEQLRDHFASLTGTRRATRQRSQPGQMLRAVGIQALIDAKAAASEAKCEEEEDMYEADETATELELAERALPPSASPLPSSAVTASPASSASHAIDTAHSRSRSPSCSSVSGSEQSAARAGMKEAGAGSIDGVATAQSRSADQSSLAALEQLQDAAVEQNKTRSRSQEERGTEEEEQQEEDDAQLAEEERQMEREERRVRREKIELRKERMQFEAHKVLLSREKLSAEKEQLRQNPKSVL